MSDAPDTVTLTIDGQEITVPKGELIIRAAERMGLVIPRFCDHPLLDPVGACRQCVVEVEGQPKPAMACTTQCGEGWTVKTHLTSTIAEKAQAGTLEFLLMNHPLDCPMCDKGGECPLQDQALEFGNNVSRFVDEKRRFDKPVAVSAQVLLDRERCVLCARCTRFSDQISGDPFIELFERGALEQVAIYEDEPYESYFSGNVIQICPVGALTSTSYRFKARPFDLVSSKSVCDGCSAGCSQTVQSRRGTVERQLARTNMATNEMWSCDKGRFGFAHLDSPHRISAPMVASGGALAETDWATALIAATTAIRTATDEGTGVAVITGGRLADEDAYAVGKLARSVYGTNDIVTVGSQGHTEDAAAIAALGSHATATYADVEAAPVVVIVGLDAEEEVPILYLRLRKAWRNNQTKLVPVGPSMGSLAGIAWRHLATMPDGETGALSAVGRALGVSSLADPAATSGFQSPSTDDVVAALRAAPGAVILVGERAPAGALAAAGRLADQVGAKVGWVPRRSGARGAADAGLHAGLLPGGRLVADDADRSAIAEHWGAEVPATAGRDLTDILKDAAAGRIAVLHLLGVDLVTDGPDAALVAKALSKATVIVQDIAETATTAHADIVLPVTAAQERAGTRTNWEGRAQLFNKALDGPKLVKDDWEVAVQIAALLGQDLGFQDIDGIRAERGRLAASSVAREWPGVDSVTPASVDGLAVQSYRLLLAGSTDLRGASALLATAPTPTVRLHPSDAVAAGIADGDLVDIGGTDVSLVAEVRADQLAGSVFVPASLGVAGSVTVSRSADQRAATEPAEVTA